MAAMSVTSARKEMVNTSRGDGGKLAQILRFIYLCLLPYSFMKYQFLIDIYRV